jgi:hypothetical protein
MQEAKTPEALEEKPLFQISKQAILDLQNFFGRSSSVDFPPEKIEFNIEQMGILIEDLRGLPDDLRERKDEYLKKYSQEDIDNALRAQPALLSDAHARMGGFLIRRGNKK